MFRTLVSRASRPLASSSRSELHTSAVCHKASKTSASKEKEEILRRLERKRAREAEKEARTIARVYAVLGSKPGQDDKWPSCELARVIITEEKLYPKNEQRSEPVKQFVPLPDMDGTLTLDASDPALERMSETDLSQSLDGHNLGSDSPDGLAATPEATESLHNDKRKALEEGIHPPRYFNYEIAGGRRKKMLFEVLPALSAERGATVFNEDTIRNAEAAMTQETQKANMFAKLVDLRNANAKGLAYENRRRIIARFSSRRNDTGRPEVQAALLTLQIRNLWSHLVRSRKDVANRRGLRMLVHQRAKILKYLKHSDPMRYEALLPRLGLEPDCVEGELIV